MPALDYDRVAHPYGDYSYAPFEPARSPFTIRVLRDIRMETV